MNEHSDGSQRHENFHVQHFYSTTNGENSFTMNEIASHYL